MNVKLLFNDKVIYDFPEQAINHYHMGTNNVKLASQQKFFDMMRENCEKLYDRIYNEYYWEDNFSIKLNEEEYNQLTTLLSFQ